MSDSTFGFNVPENKNLSFEKESKKFFEQTQEDVVFQRGKAVKSRVMSSPMFINTIKQYGVDAAKTIILQELLKMSDEEVVEELRILGNIAEENIEIKRSLRAAKFMAAQWVDDEKRGQQVRDKCMFIIESIPTFKNAPKAKEEPKKREVAPSEETVVERKPEKMVIPEVKNKPIPPENPAEPPISKYTEINKIALGEKLLVITDVQGDYNRLREYLLKYKVISPDNKWNPACKTKLILVGDLFNKSPYSSWGGQVSYQTFQVMELVRRLVSESKNNVFLSLANYDLKLCSGQVFKDLAYGFCSSITGIKVQAQAMPALMSFLESTAFDTEDNLYSCWEQAPSSNGELFFKLKEDFQIGEQPELLIKANEMYLPDITSIRSFFQNLYKELTLPKDKRPKTIEELDKKAVQFLKEKTGEDLKALLSSKGRKLFFEGILRGTRTLSFFRKFISSVHKFQNEKREPISFSHVSLQQETAQLFEKAKESNWNIDELSKVLNESKALKVKKVEPNKFYTDLKKAGFNNINDFLTRDPEEIFEDLTKKNLLELFIPSISPNKIKFGFVKGIERMQETLKMEDKTGLLGFRLVDRKQENDFDDVEMKKMSELNNSSKQAYAEKVLSDMFGNSKGFTIKVGEDKTVTCSKGLWNLTIEIDKNAALYQDQNKAIHVPIKHVVYIST